jgi:Raf kinase inhibitor-like YbhB/YbcL family protein
MPKEWVMVLVKEAVVRLHSDDFSDEERIPPRFSCDGEDVSASLRWDELPDGAAQLALTCEDPDAPRGTFVHWVMWNIDPATGRINAGEIPRGARHGRNDFGNNSYGGPCPPPGHGVHHYHFTIYALSEPIDLEEGASIDDLRSAMDGEVLDQATLIGTYER